MFYNIAYAGSPGAAEAGAFVEQVNSVILFPLISFLIALALLVFMYGAFMFIANGDNSAGRETGRQHIMYGIIGLFVMLSALTILMVAANTFGLGDELECADQPGGCGGTVFPLNSGG